VALKKSTRTPFGSRRFTERSQLAAVSRPVSVSESRRRHARVARVDVHHLNRDP
jgi:hypothetical protein